MGASISTGSGVSLTMQANFGNGFFGTTAISSEGTNASGIGKFEYDVPANFTALCTKRIKRIGGNNYGIYSNQQIYRPFQYCTMGR